MVQNSEINLLCNQKLELKKALKKKGIIHWDRSIALALRQSLKKVV